MMQKLIPVLGIEDDRDDVEAMSQALDRADIPDYYFFPEAKEFFAVFNENYRVIIIDLNLPGMNGQEILDKVLKICKKCRAIIISGVVTQELWMRLQIVGAKDFIIKKGNDWAKDLAVIVKKQLELAKAEIEEEERKRMTNRSEWEHVKSLLGKR